MSKIDIKNKIDNQLYALFNKITNILFIFSKYKKVVKKNRQFHNIHKGQRCFILGTGPSLNKIDSKLLNQEIIFGVNFLYRGDFLKNIVPNYYCLYDQIFHTTHIDETKKIMEKYPDTTFFLRTKAYKSANKHIRFKNNKVFFQYCNLFQYNDYIKINLTKPVTAPFNVLLGCIQTAIYMGFTEIYLLGSDFNSFASKKETHYYDKDDSQEKKMKLGFELKFYSLVAYHHYALNKYAKSRGIKIINLTKDSLLDAYPKQEIEQLFNS